MKTALVRSLSELLLVSETLFLPRAATRIWLHTELCYCGALCKPCEFGV